MVVLPETSDHHENNDKKLPARAQCPAKLCRYDHHDHHDHDEYDDENDDEMLRAQPSRAGSQIVLVSHSYPRVTGDTIINITKTIMIVIVAIITITKTVIIAITKTLKIIISTSIISVTNTTGAPLIMT